MVPRRWAPIHLLVGAYFIGLSQGIILGGLHFTVLRILITVAILRLFIRREWLPGGLNGLDRLMLIWMGWALISSLFHDDIYGALIYRLGLVYNSLGVYLLFRVSCRSFDDLESLVLATAILLVPIAVGMTIESFTGFNLFSILTGEIIEPNVRAGRFRAQGPFQHAILAGTVGAGCLPLFVGVWRSHSRLATIGIIATLVIIVTSASSGPVITAISGIAALMIWNYRYKMRFIRFLMVFCYFALDIVMKAPAYYLLSRIDLTGSSTGWHRAALIESAFAHLGEWWFAGTDFTRHWMPTGVDWSGDHADITNHYIKMGVIGGLPLMILFIVLFYKSFSYVGQILHSSDYNSFPQRFYFFAWCLGASLFAHAFTCLSVSYFDQSSLFLFMVIASISTAWYAAKQTEVAFETATT